MKKRILSWGLILAMTTSVLSGCGFGATGQTALTIDGTEISAADYASQVCYEKAYYESYYSGILGEDGIGNLWEDTDLQEKALSGALNRLQYSCAVRAMAEELGLEATRKEVKEAEKEAIAQCDTQAKYERYMNGIGFSMDQARELLRDNILEEKIRDYYYGENGKEPVTEETIKNTYENDYFHIRLICLKTIDASGNENSDTQVAETKAKAQDILRQLANGADFAQLVETYNEDSAQGENGYTFCQADEYFPEELVQEAKSLAIGSYSQNYVESTYGYYILQRLSLAEETLQAEDGCINGGSIYDSIYDRLTGISDLIQERIDGQVVEKTELFDAITLENYNDYLEI